MLLKRGFNIRDCITIGLGDDQEQSYEPLQALCSAKMKSYIGSLSGLTCLYECSLGYSSHRLDICVPQVDSRAGEGCSANIVSILLLFVVQGIEVGFDRERDNGRRVICEILLQSIIIHCIFDHVGGRSGGEDIYGML